MERVPYTSEIIGLDPPYPLKIKKQKKPNQYNCSLSNYNLYGNLLYSLILEKLLEDGRLEIN